jgi:hypothetical protein
MFGRSDFFIFAAAFLSLFFSIALWFGFGIPASKDAGIFVGLWVPSILATGSYFRQASRQR